MGDENNIIPRDYVVESIKAEIEIATPSQRHRIFEAITLAALGSIPWIGGVIAAGASYRAGESVAEKEGLLREWLQEHQAKLQDLRATLAQMVGRLEGFGPRAEEECQPVVCGVRTGEPVHGAKETAASGAVPVSPRGYFIGMKRQKRADERGNPGIQTLA